MSISKADTALLIFPNQLFRPHSLLPQSNYVYLIEDSLFFGDPEFPVQFHKQKLLFHRVTMTYYHQYLESQSSHVKYIKYDPNALDSVKNIPLVKLFSLLRERDIKHLLLYDPVDFWLNKRLQNFGKENEIIINIKETPLFLSSINYLTQYFQEHQSYRQTSFYINQRKRFNILLTKDQKPVGGKWSFDKKNRRKLPNDIQIPPNLFINYKSDLDIFKKEIVNQFPENPGSLESFNYPITHAQAEDWLMHFLEHRLTLFGPYEDAIHKNNSILFHSQLSPLMNTGLLIPQEIVDKVLHYTKSHNVPINSVEGFIRQLIGWREFIRAIYDREGTFQRTRNFWNHHKTLPPSLYNGTTGILPVDIVINRLLDTAYLHHIERLMILGNFMVLTELNPDEVYLWFMELFIDAYDWVMVPNVYGMSLNADGGLMATKPYISSSNYIRKMSNYPKGPWCVIWDGLYWRFIHKHQSIFRKNPRMRMMVSLLDRMKPEKLENHLEKANNFLKDFWI